MRREQTYWVVIAASAVALICLYVFWVMPVRAQLARERGLLVTRLQLLDKLYPAASGLPPQRAVEDMRDYKKWLDGVVTSNVKPFLTALGRNLEEPMHAPDGTVADTPAKFKAAYQTRLAEVRAQFQREHAGVTLPGDMFPRYDWAEGAGLPDPKSFKQVTFDFNFRKALQNLLGRLPVSQVTVLRIDYGKSHNIEGFCRAIPVTLGANVRPDKIMDTLQTLLGAATAPRDDALAVFVQSMTFTRDANPGSTSSMAFVITFEVLDFFPLIGEKAPAPAPKAETPGRPGS